jgi:hypothetical protein
MCPRGLHFGAKSLCFGLNHKYAKILEIDWGFWRVLWERLESGVVGEGFTLGGWE